MSARRSIGTVGALALTALAAAPMGAAARTPVIRGEVRALAVSGDAVIVARTLPGRRFVVERRVTGAAPRTLLRERGDPFTREVALAASRDAVALAVQGEAEGGPSRVLVGPSTGPLREVTRCAKGFLVPAVAVDGTRIAWTEGGCLEPLVGPADVSPATLAVGDVDPAVAVRHVALPEDRIPASIVPEGDGGLVGLYRPSFASFVSSEIRRFGAGGIGDVILRRPGAIVLPVGIPAGSPPLIESAVDEDFEDGSRPGVCSVTLFALPVGGAQPRLIALPGCPDGSQPVAVTADRLVARLTLAERRSDRGRFERTAIVTARPDGTSPRTLVRGTFRGPGVFTAGAGRVAFTQPHCAGDTELVARPVAGPGRALRACTVEPLTHRARVRRGAIAVRLRCPRGCAGVIVDDSRCGARYLRSFRSEAGTRTVHVTLGRRLRRARRVLLRFRVEHGPQRVRVVRLRR